MKIDEAKLVYPDFKLFKNIFTSINKAEEVIFYGEDGSAKLLFSRDNNYFILTGSLTCKDSYFLKWLIDGNKTVAIPCSDLRTISNTLKRDVKSLTFNENSFSFEYSGGEDVTFTKILLNTSKYDDEKEKVKKIFSKLTHSKSFSDDILDEDILELYTDENMEITENRTTEKLIEIPVKRILSLIRGGTATISFSERNELGQRLVSIKGKNEDLGLELDQIFMTI